MTHPAFDVLVAAARHLEARDGTVTGAASATVLSDSNWGLRTQPTDQFKGGTYFQKLNSATDWSAIRVIATSVAGTYTLASGLPATPAVGSAYTVLGNSYPAQQLTQKLMAVVDEFGDTISQDTSLLTVADQYAYTIPGASTNVVRVLAVEVEDPYRTGVYEPALGVKIDDARGVLVFPYAPVTAGQHIRLTLSTSNHLEINIGSLPALPDSIHPSWASLEVAARVAYWRLMSFGDETGKQTQFVQTLFERAKTERNKRQLQRPTRQPRLFLTEVP